MAIAVVGVRVPLGAQNKNRTMEHTPELVDAEEDIYECTKCGARGKYTELLNQNCKENQDDDEPQSEKPSSTFGGLLGRWAFDSI